MKPDNDNDKNENEISQSQNGVDKQQETSDETKNSATEETATVAASETINEPVLKEEQETEKLKNEIVQWNDKYLRLYSEFENYKRRAIRDRTELLKTAGVEIILSMLSVMDDFERALKSIGTIENSPFKEGIELIYNKFKTTLQQLGLQEMVSVGTVFNPDLYDAITNASAPSEEMKGKVIEEMQKGYYLNGKIIRHAKVIVGN